MSKLLQQILECKTELVRLGYREGEVGAFIHEVIGDKALASLNDEESNEVVDYLQDYINFAKKSHKIAKA